MLNVGDRVGEYDRRRGNPDELVKGTVTAVPGMPEYDNRGYVAASEGCAWVTDDGVRLWSFVRNLTRLEPIKPNWEV